MKRIKYLHTITKIGTNVFGALSLITLIGGSIAMTNADAINAALNAETQIIIEGESTKDTLYHKSDFESIRDLKNAGQDIGMRIAYEGTVLLKNDNDALPLVNKNISFYSASSVAPVYTGAGSSGNAAADKIDLKTAFEAEGFKVNADLYNWYKDNASTYVDRNVGQDVLPKILDASWDQITTSSKNNSADAAIFILSRYGGESEDVSYNNGDASDMNNGNYLELSNNEISVLTNLKTLKDNNTVKKIIVVMNTPTYVQTDFIFDNSYGIDAVLWCGELGTSGSKGLARVMTTTGNPSGRTIDTMLKKTSYNPVYANWLPKHFSSGTMPAGEKSQTFTVYQEGIYNGYRYTETRYEDVVLNRENVGSFNYNQVVGYPFGYGLSYTTFSYSNFEVTPDGNDYNVSLTVSNDGEVAGKEVVQIYLQKPYTDYDKTNHIEKSAIDLVGYTKTQLLAPHTSEVVTIKVGGKYLASYDAYNRKTYIVDEGTYYLTAGKNAHDAINNILAAKGKTTMDGMTENGNSALTYSFNKEFDDVTYSKSITNKTITNRFDNADVNLYNDGVNTVTYLTRNNWVGTINQSVSLLASSKMIADGEKLTPEADSGEYPIYGANHNLSLIDLRAEEDEDDDPSNDRLIPYNDPRWEDLLDQLTFEETALLLSNGLRMTMPIESIQKGQTYDHNGALGPIEKYNSLSTVSIFRYSFLYDDPQQNSYPTQYPCGGLIASTYNDELIEELGNQIGEECLWAGYNGLYGPGCNIHRGAHCGRSFEYYSEDPFLSGKVAKAEIIGIQDKGAYAYLKHAVLNDCEGNREGICTFANEQTIREIYLRPFEIAIEEGGCKNVMTSFNRIGSIWSGQQGFVKYCLKEEFGMTGFAISDFWQSSYMNLVGGILNGNDLPDGTTSSSGADSALMAYKTGYSEVGWAMRESAHRLLYTVVHSNAMNGISSDTIIINVTPTWQKLLKGLTISSTVFFIISFLGLAFSEILILKERKKVKNI